MRVVFHPGTWIDLEEQTRYLNDQNAPPEVVSALFKSFWSAVSQIERNPLTWSFMSGSKRARKVQIPRFRMQLVYTIRNDDSLLVVELIGPGIQPRWPDRL
jgi:hypothetical protein